MFGQEWRRHSAFSGQRTQTLEALAEDDEVGQTDWGHQCQLHHNQNTQSCTTLGLPTFTWGLKTKRNPNNWFKVKNKSIWLVQGRSKEDQTQVVFCGKILFDQNQLQGLPACTKKPTGFQSLWKTIQQRLSGRFCVLLGWTLTSMLQSIYPSNYNLPATNNIICNPVDVFAKKKVNDSLFVYPSDALHQTVLMQAFWVRKNILAANFGTTLFDTFGIHEYNKFQFHKLLLLKWTNQSWN